MRNVPAESVRRIEAVLGADDAQPETVRVIRAGQQSTFTEPADLVLENGSRESLAVVGRRRRGRQPVASRLPSDVPLGYHTVHLLESGRQVSLIVTPERCHLPASLRIWAWAVQLYAARSRRSWGIGDFGDLARFAASAKTHGCRLLLMNPLHAATPVVPQQPSPYADDAAVSQSTLLGDR
jgi:4-alpha-glucanotransferase